MLEAPALLAATWQPRRPQSKVRLSRPFCVATSGTMCSFSKIAVTHAIGETEQRKIVSVHQLRQTNILNENLRLDLDVCVVFAHRTRIAPIGMNHVVATMTAALARGKTATGSDTPWPLWYSKRRAFWWTMLSVDGDALNAKQTKTPVTSVRKWAGYHILQNTKEATEMFRQKIFPKCYTSWHNFHFKHYFVNKRYKCITFKQFALFLCR